MAEHLHISNGSKEDKYRALLPQVKSLMANETIIMANLANLAAALNETFRFLWVGFYLVKGEELILSTFQGPIACTRIRKGSGVCGTAWERAETIIVPDVNKFPGHIACNFASRSEIVVPLFGKDKQVWGVLDIDSEQLNTFDAIDQQYLEEMCNMLHK
ncbi:MAG: GAF domain-containing protein [Prevotellaceae bacterium]|jgi:GAF domain-containing protein|nr:GAF domain-containing protein [Prevotellaceae bacterium]